MDFYIYYYSHIKKYSHSLFAKFEIKNEFFVKILLEKQIKLQGNVFDYINLPFENNVNKNNVSFVDKATDYQKQRENIK